MPVVYTSVHKATGTDVAPAAHIADPTDGTTCLAAVVSIIDALEGVGIIGDSASFLVYSGTDRSTGTLVTGAADIADPTDEAECITACAAIIDALEAAGLVAEAA